MKATTKTVSGTSFFHETFIATKAQLKKILPQGSYQELGYGDKTTFEAEMETETGKVFTIYD